VDSRPALLWTKFIGRGNPRWRKRGCKSEAIQIHQSEPHSVAQLDRAVPANCFGSHSAQTRADGQAGTGSRTARPNSKPVQISGKITSPRHNSVGQKPCHSARCNACQFIHPSPVFGRRGNRRMAGASIFLADEIRMPVQVL
jgi:hypothetical protein